MGIVKQLVDKYVDKNYKTLNDLPSSSLLKVSDSDKIDNTRILIIDDDELELKGKLEGIGYRVSWKKDIEEIDEVKIYSVIICDYKGVGVKFSSKYEGLNLIKLIREKYPNKIIYLLSAASFDSRANDFFKYFDESVLKGDEDKLIEFIKQDIEKFFDPKESWKNYKNILKSKGVSEKEIFKLEDLYVRSFINKKDLLSNNDIFIQVNNNLNVKFDINVGLINL